MQHRAHCPIDDMNVLGHSGAKGHESQTKAGANLGTMRFR
ncbi:PAC2 family protein, partial [Cutibacterium acnes]